MTNEIDLLKAIVTDKADDTVRLAYADWLDEQPTGWVKCDHHSCGVDAAPGHVRVNSGKNYVWGEPREKLCPRCDGTATVPDDSRKSRAEFIRVQIALAHLNPKTGYNPAVERLQRRERVLAHHAAAWWGIPCHEGFGKPPAGTFGCVAKRGFVSALTCTAADWLTRADAIYWHPQCPRCRGDGVVRVPPPASTYQLSATCPECHGSAKNSRPFPPTAMPLEAVTLTTTLYLRNRRTDSPDDDVRLSAISPATVPGDDKPISRALRASAIHARTKERGERNWVVAACDLLWPGIHFILLNGT